MLQVLKKAANNCFRNTQNTRNQVSVNSKSLTATHRNYAQMEKCWLLSSAGPSFMTMQTDYQMSLLTLTTNYVHPKVSHSGGIQTEQRTYDSSHSIQSSIITNSKSIGVQKLQHQYTTYTPIISTQTRQAYVENTERYLLTKPCKDSTRRLARIHCKSITWCKLSGKFRDKTISSSMQGAMLKLVHSSHPSNM